MRPTRARAPITRTELARLHLFDGMHELGVRERHSGQIQDQALGVLGQGGVDHRPQRLPRADVDLAPDRELRRPFLRRTERDRQPGTRQITPSLLFDPRQVPYPGRA